ncbi:superoxide dismutase family protein [Nocardia halotolerans]|uniref:Superoxide dismutase family protein n=1 Tax=Nocardia halotolerans TaxID=1755878 RepID=A0ABV8VNS0_9NOCA
MRISRRGTPASPRTFAVTAAIAVAGALVAACSPDQETSDATGTTPAVWTGSTIPGTAGETPAYPGHSPGGNALTAGFVDAQGTTASKVTFIERAGFVEVQVDVSGLSPGFHGVHIHERGVCETDSAAPTGGERGDFLSAGGHLQVDGHSEYPASGDLTNIHVRPDGTGMLTTATSAFSLEDLRNGGQGRAVIVHAEPSNFGNVPDRYTLPGGGPVPDEETLSTSDAGARVACAVVS